jgi:hypothetical protein
MLDSVHNIHTGKLLEDYLKKHRITKANLGRAIGRGGISIVGYIMNRSIQTGILLDLCYALKHNFFQDMANMLPNDFTVTNDLKSGKDKRIAELEEENKVLKIQNEVLMRLRG